MTLQSPLFKGATRPACFLGVPLKPFVAVTGAIALTALWTTPPVALAAVPAVALMRAMTRDDDQRFRQIALSLALRQRRELTAYAPCRKRSWP